MFYILNCSWSFSKGYFVCLNFRIYVTWQSRRQPNFIPWNTLHILFSFHNMTVFLLLFVICQPIISWINVVPEKLFMIFFIKEFNIYVNLYWEILIITKYSYCNEWVYFIPFAFEMVHSLNLIQVCISAMSDVLQWLFFSRID